MEIIEYNGEKSVVISYTTFKSLKDKIIAQRQLIEEFQKEFEKND